MTWIPKEIITQLFAGAFDDLTVLELRTKDEILLHTGGNALKLLESLHPIGGDAMNWAARDDLQCEAGLDAAGVTYPCCLAKDHAGEHASPALTTWLKDEILLHTGGNALKLLESLHPIGVPSPPTKNHYTYAPDPKLEGVYVLNGPGIPRYARRLLLRSEREAFAITTLLQRAYDAGAAQKAAEVRAILGIAKRR